jgi:hypothetical protein
VVVGKGNGAAGSSLFRRTTLAATQYVFFICGCAEPFAIVSHLDRKKSPPALSSSLVFATSGSTRAVRQYDHIDRNANEWDYKPIPTMTSKQAPRPLVSWGVSIHLGSYIGQRCTMYRSYPPARILKIRKLNLQSQHKYTEMRLATLNMGSSWQRQMWSLLICVYTPSSTIW